jgi:hypothetical protein
VPFPTWLALRAANAIQSGSGITISASSTTVQRHRFAIASLRSPRAGSGRHREPSAAALLCSNRVGPQSSCFRRRDEQRGYFIGAVAFKLSSWIFRRWWPRCGEKKSIYRLQHGRLHIQASTPMWMKMGYWPKEAETPVTLAVACRYLLEVVLSEAGFSKDTERVGIEDGTRRTKCLIDPGFGCGNQTMYLRSEAPVLPCEETGGMSDKNASFDRYVGSTKDVVQARYASERVEELGARERSDSRSKSASKTSSISLFCADAAIPTSWNEQIKGCIDQAVEETQEHWVLALDTAYHFSPSRWPLVTYTYSSLDASFMAFDLCISPTATVTQRLVLRLLTALTGAPWASFVTPNDYRRNLVECEYSEDSISIKDVSHRVFTPLSRYLVEQDARLQTMGLSIGSFRVARSLFAWWGRTGVVQGVIVVARR